jgi:hypothetical protein
VIGWHAFRTGLARTLRYWQVWLALFTVNLLSALLLATLPAMVLASGPGHNPAIHAAADGVDAWLVIETLMSPLAGSALAGSGADPRFSGGVQQAFLVGLITMAALPFLAWLPSALLNGGLLLTYAELPQRFRWRRFLWGCWHWWGAFLLLGAVQGAAVLLILAPLVIVAIVAMVAIGDWFLWLAVPTLALMAMLGLALTEYTRILAVTTGTRNILRTFGLAVRLIWRNPLAVAVLYVLSLMLAALLHAVYRVALMPYLPLEWWPLVLLVQQGFIAARLGARLARLAGGVTLIGLPVLKEQDLL